MNVKKIRVIGILVALLLTGFVSTTLISYFVSKDSIATQIAQSTLPLTSDTIYSEIQRDLLNPIFISSLMAQDTFMRDWTLAGEEDPTAIIKYLKEIQDRYATVTCFFVSEQTRRYYHPSGVLKTVRESDPQDEWYFRVQKMKAEYEINVDADTANRNALNIFINYKVYDYQHRYIGATGVGLAVTAVMDMLNSYRQRYGRDVYFIDRAGNLTLSGSEAERPGNIREIPGMGGIATQILASPGFSGSYDSSGGGKAYVNSRFVPEFGWYLIVEQRDDPSEARIQGTLVVNAVVSVVVSVIILFFANLTLGGYQKRLEDMAGTDRLTGVMNRQRFEPLFEHMLKFTVRRTEQLSAIMFDIDNFKAVNDSRGHLAGDEALREIVKIAGQTIRESDILCRWGGDEFLILLPDCGIGEAEGVAGKLRSGIAARVIERRGAAFSVTCSFGVASIKSGETGDAFIERADKALYRAKNEGRNRVATSEA